MATPKVKVLAPSSRKFFLLRWKARDGRWCEETTDIEIPPKTNPRAFRLARSRADRLAAEKEKELATAATKGVLGDLLEDFKAAKEAEGKEPRYISQTASQLKAIFEWCHWITPADIDDAELTDFLDHLRRHKKLSIDTLNHYLAAAKTFCSWLVRRKKLAANPVVHIKKRNAEVDRRRLRRAFTLEEIELLAQAAELSEPVEHIPGAARAASYWVACYTGLRAGEIASLTVKDFQFDHEQPTVTVDATESKRKTKDVLPLHPYAAEKVQEYLRTLPTIPLGEPIFQMLTANGRVRRISKAMVADLKAARTIWLSRAKGQELKRRTESDFLLHKDHQGRYADFHSLRYSFVSLLASAGVSPTHVMKLARHSDFRLTANIYTQLGLLEAASEIAMMPTPGRKKAQQ